MTEIFYPESELVVAYTSAICMAAIGPLFYLYQTGLWGSLTKLAFKNYLHFLPSFLIAGSGFFFNSLRTEIILVLYIFSILVLVTYIIIGSLKLFRKPDRYLSDSIKWSWYSYLSIGMIAISSLIFIQLFLFDEYAYMLSIIASAIVGYLLSLWAVKYVRLFKNEPHRRNEENQKINELGKKIEEILQRETLFTDPLITVPRLAKHINEPPYLVSIAINKYFNKSFPEIINELRIKKAKQLLTDHKKKHYSIEAIAYESGFNTLSAFYSGFKKNTHKTPLQYRSQLSSENSTENQK